MVMRVMREPLGMDMLGELLAHVVLNARVQVF